MNSWTNGYRLRIAFSDLAICAADGLYDGRLRERSYGYLALSGKAAFVRLAQEKQAAFLNPGFACGKQFVRDVIDRLAGGEKAVPKAGAADGTPAPEPIEEDGEKSSKPWWKIW